MKSSIMRIAAVALAFSTVAVSPALACEECQLRKAGTYFGTFTLIGNGTVRSWVKIAKTGQPEAIGVTFSELALSGLPETLPEGKMTWMYTLALPEAAKITGFNHVVVDWNPKGHKPMGIYDIPHFDFHFYTVEKKFRDKITAKGEDLKRCRVQPSDELMPPDYIMAEGTEVPMMGAHAIDPTSAEFNNQSFTQTFIYGFYEGRQTFLEPMITKALFETKPNLTFPVKQPAAYSKSGCYPSRYSITFDPVRREYTVALEGLTYRNGKGKQMSQRSNR